MSPNHIKDEVDLKDAEMVEDSERNDLPIAGIDPVAEAKYVLRSREVIPSHPLLTNSRLVRKIDIRLMPTTAIIYLLCYLDRSNIGQTGNLPAQRIRCC